MKRVLVAGISALAMVTMIGAANAADVARRQAMPAKAPVYVAPIYNWTGFYAGINGGYGWGSSEWTNGAGSTGSFDVNGGVVGGTIGYNWQMGQTVFGIEGDLDWSGISGSTLGVETKNNWLGTVRGRVGYAFDRIMPYITGGLAVGDVEANAAGFGSETTTNVGWTLGGGAEFALAGPWTAKLEYLYVDLGSGWCGPATCVLGTDVDFHTNLVRGGINYRF
jgi:outer membrane immunogenic protein